MMTAASRQIERQPRRPAVWGATVLLALLIARLTFAAPATTTTTARATTTTSTTTPATAPDNTPASLEWAVEEAELIVHGTVRPGSGPEVIIDVDETLKGTPAPHVTLAAGAVDIALIQPWGDVLLFCDRAAAAVRANAASGDAIVWAIHGDWAFVLGEQTRPVFRTDGTLVARGDALLAAVREAAAFARARGAPAASVAIPNAGDVAAPDAPARGANATAIATLRVPCDARLEAIAQRWLDDREWYRRQYGLVAIPPFPSPANVARVRKLFVTDAAFYSEAAEEWSPAIEERYWKEFPVRQAALNCLVRWGQSSAVDGELRVPLLRYAPAGWRTWAGGAAIVLAVGVVIGWRRGARAFAAVTLLGLALGVAIFAWQSAHAPRTYSLAALGADWELAAAGGRLAVLRVQDDAGPHGAMVRPYDLDEGTRLWFAPYLDAREDVAAIGCRFATGITGGAGGYSFKLVELPWWALVAVAMAWPATYAIGHLRRARRRRRRQASATGRCGVCGADLQGAGGRCPQCGAGGSGRRSRSAPGRAGGPNLPARPIGYDRRPVRSTIAQEPDMTPPHKRHRHFRSAFCTPLLLLLAAAASARADEYPKTTLDNGTVSIDVYTPDAATGFYRGLRYDHAGMVGQARWGGHTFFGEFNAPHDPLVHDHGAGTVEEFGMTLTPPIGFASAKAGEAFLKIGVGVLAKNRDDENYFFAGKYKVLEQPGWKVDVKKDSIEFSQSAATPKGLAYEYVKRVELTPDGFRLIRSLKNTGKDKWATDHYGHNYIIIDQRPIDPAYKVELPFAAKVEEEHEIKANVSGKALEPAAALPAKGAIWVRVSGFDDTPRDNVMRVESSVAKAGVEIATDQPMRRFVLYSTKAAFCPESFIEFELGPGETKRWTTTYRFYSTDH